MAGRGGFEPPEVLPSPVFKTGTFDHSDISRRLEATPGFEPGIRALQAPALATWLCRQYNPYKFNIFKSIKGLAIVVPGAGLEPARPKRPRDFKSLVSTNSTTRARVGQKRGAGDGIRTRGPNLGKVVLYP